MADKRTPESDKKTVSKTNAETDTVPTIQGPTPKNEVKGFGGQRHGFMSPTDAMTSPCTQQLMNHHRYPRRQTRPVPKSGLLGNTRPVSKLANKENLDKQSEGKDVKKVESSADQTDSTAAILKSS